MKLTALAAAAVLLATVVARAAAPPAPPAAPVLPAAEVIVRIPADEARQGVAVDERYLYPVANSRIGKYDKATHAKLAEWRGSPQLYPHINHCSALEKKLVCASSNYPQVPMSSSVEIFDPVRMAHERTISFGPMIGSLTWIDRKDGFWWATFANYDGQGGDPGRDHRFTTLVKFDDQWRRMEGWSFPASVLERFTPMSSSGGAWGPDGLLYITGHDHTELYVLRLPAAGSVLEHVATIPMAVEGQAIVWDRSARERILYGISRPKLEIVGMRIPSLPAALLAKAP